MNVENYPQFPLYIPTKGRSEYMITSQALAEMGVKHYLIVEPQEVKAYQEAIKKFRIPAEIVELDLSYKEKYEKCDNLGLTKSCGPGPARNFAWDHSIKNGFKYHWVMDDNILCFRRYINKQRIKCVTPSFWRAMEDFVLRYKNIAMAGPNYSMFAFGSSKLPPFVMNTRIYSCNLIRNDIPFRWRGRYNEDTILSLDCLKAGWTTVQFNAFLQNKLRTQTIKGGNTDEFYHAEGTLKKKGDYADNGTLEKSKMQVRVHPDCSEIVWKFGRIHHKVDYSRFKNQKLIRTDEPIVEKDYGFKLKKVKK